MTFPRGFCHCNGTLLSFITSLIAPTYSFPIRSLSCASSAILVYVIFPCKVAASVRTSNTAALIVFMDWTATFRKSKIDFQSPYRYASGWVFLSIPDHLFAFPVLFPLPYLHVKSLTRSRRSFEEREVKNKLNN